MGIRSHVIPIVLLITLMSIMFSSVFGDGNKDISHTEVKMIDVLYYRDGGTTGFITKVDGKKELFCLDGRAVSGIISKPQWHVFLDATHPTHVGAKKVPIGGKEEARIITILSSWINSELSTLEQKELLHGQAPRTDLQKTKLWWAMRVRARLASRQISPNNVVQPTRPNSGRATDH